MPGGDLSNQLTIKLFRKRVRVGLKVILVTGHRRENIGAPLVNICLALRCIAEKHPECAIVFPVHLNPAVKKAVSEHLKNIENVHLLSPLTYPEFIYVLSISHIVVTDSGGVQEEAPYFGKPVLLLRENTERPEGVESGTVKIVGDRMQDIVTSVDDLLGSAAQYNAMSIAGNPYGDGFAAKRLVEFIETI